MERCSYLLVSTIVLLSESNAGDVEEEAEDETAIVPDSQIVPAPTSAPVPPYSDPGFLWQHIIIYIYFFSKFTMYARFCL